jgi:predicted metal-dependent peptidase
MTASTDQETIVVKIVEVPMVPAERMKASLQNAIFNLTRRQPFLGSVLQCMDITYSISIPTAGVMFSSNSRKWQMLINADFFCNKLNDLQREAVLQHELYHITHKHPIRLPFSKIDADKRQLMNVAMDMAINQYIPNLPTGCPSCPPFEMRMQGKHCTNESCPGACIDVNDFWDEEDGKRVAWNKEATTEYYYLKLKQFIQDHPEMQGTGGRGQGDGDVDSNGKGQNGPLDTLDSHHWDSNAAEGDMLDATEELVKRAMQKASLTMDRLPGHVKELLSDIEARRSELNYKKLIESAIKRHASGVDRKHTWSRPSRRYGNIAPGNKNGNLPFLANFIDTSGSISIQEANDFLDIIDNFLKVGARKCTIDLWHTQVYHHTKYKFGERFNKSDFQAGGTDVSDALKKIHDRKPDLSIILTDGCFYDVDVESWMRPSETFPQVLWIISKDGTEDHPLRRIGETIKIPH